MAAVIDRLDGIGDPVAFVRHADDGAAELDLVIENLHCPSCMPRIERAAGAVPGVLDARVNLTTKRLHVRWRPDMVEAGEVIGAVEDAGFALIPIDGDVLSGADAPAARVLLRSLAVAGFAAGNVMLLSVSVWSGLVSDMGPATRALMHWVSALIALPAIAYAGLPFYRSAWSALRGARLNMDVPISLAVILAGGMSLFETITHGEHVYFDAAVMLLFFLLIGRYLDVRVRGKARAVAENLLSLRATSATVIAPDGTRRAVPIRDVVAGMRVAVAAGERIPVDGRVVAGRTDIDTSLVTGETTPLTAVVGSDVHAGTVNLTGPVEIEVTAAAEATLLAEIVRLMEAATQHRARYVRWADRVARFYAPAVHILAAVTFVGWLGFGGVDWQAALLIAIAVLIVTCPCALGLAVPVVQVVAVGRLLRDGVLIKAADALERLAAIDTVVFDKTGTLTDGRPELIGRAGLPAEALHRAAAIAAHSRHPLARALCRAVNGPGLVVEDVAEHPGFGLSARIDGIEWRLGSREWCDVAGEPESDADGPEIWLASSETDPVRFAFRDRPRGDAAALVAAIKQRGLRVELLSGDRAPVVAGLAAELGIDDWRAACRPPDKMARLDELATAGRKVLMVGDGLNDAPALAGAFVSASLARAADVSQTAADIVIQTEALMPLAGAIRTARVSRRLVFQNFGLAFSYNALAIPVAMAGFVTPLIAAIAMSASSIVVTLNALRLNVIGGSR